MLNSMQHDKPDDKDDDETTQLCLSREEEDESRTSSNSEDVEAASNPHKANEKLLFTKKKKNDKEEPSNQQCSSSNDSSSNADDDHSFVTSFLFCRNRQGRVQHPYQSGRVLLRLGALFLLVVAVLLVALLTILARRDDTAGSTSSTTRNSHDGIPGERGQDSTSNDGTMRPQWTIAPTASPTLQSNLIATLPLCIQVSYQLEHLEWTAEQVRDQDGTTLRTGLEIAANHIAQDFCDSYFTARQEQQGHVLTTQPAAYPAQVTNIVDISTFCPHPYCLVVSQRVCVVYQPPPFQGQDKIQSTMNDMELAFRQAVRNAISTSALLELIPSQHLP